MAWDWQEAAAYYKKQGAPADQSALIALLREVQQENSGSIPGFLVAPLAETLGAKESLLQALIRRIPSLRLSDSHCLELCAGPNCSKHPDLAAFAEKHCAGKVTIKYVPCMRMCGKGPNLKWDGKLYHGADEALIKQLMEET